MVIKIDDYKLKNRRIHLATLGFLINDNKVLFAEKKVRFGKGKITGIGGKVKDKESLRNALMRESLEEINVKPLKLNKIAVLNFLFPYKKMFVEKGTGLKYSWDQQVHTYLISKWKGDPRESEEVKPIWFNIKNIPYDKMWADAPFWIPLVLRGEKLIADFIFNNDFKIENFRIQKMLA